MTRSRHVLAPFGTRPEVVKLAPVVTALRRAGHRVDVVDTGQHTDPELSSRMQGDLGLRPTVRFELPADPSARTGALHAHAATAVRQFTPGVRMSRYFAETYTGPDGAPVADPCAVLPAVGA